MGRYDDVFIRVQSDWNAWRNAAVRVGDLDDVHWCRPPRAPRAVLHGYVSCACLVAGEPLHDCDQTSAPHRLRVCVLERHTIPAVYAELARRADEQPLSPLDSRAIAGAWRCSGPVVARRV